MPYKKGVSGKSPLQEKKTLFTFSDTHNDRVRKTPPSFPLNIEAFPKKTATFPKKDATFLNKYHYRFKNIYIRKSKNITFYIHHPLNHIISKYRLTFRPSLSSTIT